MARAKAGPKKMPKSVFAWVALGLILIWLAMIWPRTPAGTVDEVKATSPRETSATPGSPATKTPEPGSVVRAEVVAETLNFRSKPDAADKTIIMTLTKGTFVTIVGRQPEWLIVRLDDGRSGYVADKPAFIRPVE